MKERPILFLGAMVRALLAGTKTQTRRVCKPAEAAALSYVAAIQNPADHGQRPLEVLGSGWLWVREAWSHAELTGMRGEIAGVPQQLQHPNFFHYSAEWLHSQIRWTPGIHMPRWASRVLLEVTDVRVERLQAISADDCFAEGIELRVETPAKTHFARLWDEINGAGAWAANPWVWTASFRSLSSTGGISISPPQGSTAPHRRETS